jgi:hypothetical protein
MNTLWVSVNTTALESAITNIVEMSVIFQVDGEVIDKKHWNIHPILHEEDVIYGVIKDPKMFLLSYAGWQENKSPMYSLEYGPGFFYNKSTLSYLKKSPEELLLAEQKPKDVLLELLEGLEGRKWSLVGHNAPWIADHLKGWAQRCDKDAFEALHFEKVIDTQPFFQVAAAFLPIHGYALKDVAKTFGRSVGLDTQSKLNALFSICKEIIHEPSHLLPSQEF